MKKILYILTALLCVGNAAFAQQEERTMRVIPAGYMPEKGDISIGFATAWGGSPIARPVIEESMATEITIARYLLPRISLMGKYQLGETTALRANVGFLGSSVNERYYVQDDKLAVLDPLSQAKVVDTYKQRNNGASIAIGIEKQRAYRNVRGFAAASALYAFGKSTIDYVYGNAITAINQTPTTFENIYFRAGYLDNARFLKQSYDNAHAVGAVGHVGVEWFFSPKVSLGGEMNVSFLYQWTPQVSATYEGWDIISNSLVEYTDLYAPKSSGFYYGTDNLGANLSLNFYF
ncbi:MAG: hypothetical protein LBU90_09545 [Bacteroidales bacterium]|jgi:hypothetical protein|nr:hypothetical protein [Bacteroidales bacterium]